MKSEKLKVKSIGKKIALFAILVVVSAVLVKNTFVSAKEEDKGPLTKITFIHYKKDKNDEKTLKARPTRQPTSSCYGFLAKGAKWKTPENYLINPDNGNSLSEAFVREAIDKGVSEWEKYGGNIFGAGNVDYGANYNNGDFDGINTTSFGVYPEANVIAITTVWGYFGGSPQTRELLEWDILFNTNFSWGDAIADPSKMDLQNIATHELGHSAGMKDLYETACTAETMYGYSSEGEITKRDLSTGDIKGIQELY